MGRNYLGKMVKSNQIRTVDKKRLVKFLGSISSEERLQEIEQALLIHLGISLVRNK
ncbi:MAG: type II toxin-antitoxin system PemK/MazF family toxin [Nitrospinae bacterium]|nr:type II toxin-antitoxin system PemK/MazF family toxin [Nitrospinota bacterium]MBI3815151.1 type II toxin-antitoxin system PemK/MazF family toxin [Nitrospinota bacterium]